MEISIVDSHDAFLALRPEWEALSARAPTAHLFNTHDWLSSWWEAFATPDDELRVYCARSLGTLVGVAPMMSSPSARAHSLGLGTPRRLRSMFNHYLGRSDFLIDGGHEGVAEALLRALFEDPTRWDVVELSQVPEDSPVVASLAVAPPEQTRAYAARVLASPYLELDGDDFDAYYETTFGGRRRQQDRRRRRQAEATEGFQLRVLTEPEAVKSALEAGLEVEALGWKGDQGSAMKSRPEVARFMREVVRRFAERGQVVFVELRFGDQMAAFLLGFVFRDTFYFHKTGFDPSFGALSPGRIVLLESLAEAFRRKLRRYDFLGAPDEYKTQCTPWVRPHATIFLYRDTVRGRAAWAWKRALVPTARRLLKRGGPAAIVVDAPRSRT